MKKFDFIMLFLISVISIYAEDGNTIYKDLAGGPGIQGNFTSLPSNLMSVDQCHSGDYQLLYCSGTATAYYFSAQENKILWSKVGQGGIFKVTDRGVLKSSYGDSNIFKTMFYDPTGRLVWKKSVLPVYVDDSAKVVIAYTANWNTYSNDVSFSDDNVVYAYRLTDGKQLWSDTIPHHMRWGWNDIKKLNGKYLLWADKLYLINPETGIEKSIVLQPARYGAVTDRSKENRSFENGNDADYSFSPYTERGFLRGIKSNIVFNDGKIYLADAEDIYCFDDNLNVLWFSQLPKNNTSAMRLNLDDNKITLLSCGYAYSEGIKYSTGKPFVAQYEASTGRQFFLRYIPLTSKITNACLGKDKAFLLTKDHLNIISSFENPQVKVADNSVSGKVEDIDYTTSYVIENGKILPLSPKENTLLLKETNGKMQLFNADKMKAVRTASKESTFKKVNGLFIQKKDNDKSGTGDIIIADNDTVKAHLHLRFVNAFYNSGVLTIIMNNGFFSTRY